MRDTRDLRYVAHLDMLGMSQLSESDPDGAWRALCGLTDAKSERFNLAFEVVETGELIKDRVTTFTFSDTIVAFSAGNADSDLRAMVVLITEFFTRAMYYRVPLRGGIAHGRFMFNFEHNLFAGPALVRAYHLGEKAQWLGVRVDEGVAQHAERIRLQAAGGFPSITKWHVPTAGDTSAESHVVDWVAPHLSNFKVRPPFSAAQFYEPFAAVFGAFDTLPSSVQAKYENTVAFINERFAACTNPKP